MLSRSLRDDGQSGLSGDEEEDAGTEAEAGPVAPDIQLDLDVIVNIDSGKLSFICYQKADENPEMLFARPPGIKSGSCLLGRQRHPCGPTQHLPPNPNLVKALLSLPFRQWMLKAHYSSQQAGERTAVAQSARTTSPPSSPLHPRQDPGQQKRGLMYVWAQMKSPEDEIVVTTSILDFLEQALKVIPPAVDTADATSPTESEPSHPKEDETDIDASTNSLVSSSAVDYTTFPVDVIVYFLVQPSVIHLTCLPASRVECLLQLPCTELSFSSTEFVDDGSNDVGDERFTSPNRRRQFSGDDSMDARKSANSGLHCSIVLSNFSLVVFHPYGEQFRKDLSQKVTEQQQRQQQPPSDASGGPDKPQAAASMSRNALSLEVNLVKVNISRQRSREFPNIAGVSFFHGSPAGAPMSPARTIINQFSVICDMGSASFHYDMRRLTEMLAFPKAWYRKSLAKRLFLGKEARSPDEESYSGSDSGSQTGHFSRLPSRHVKRRSPLRKGTSFQQTPASPGNRSKRIQEEPSSGDDEDTASPNLSMGQRKAKLPSRRERLQSLHTRSIKDDNDVQGVREALKKLSKKEGRPQSPQVTKQDRAPKWKTVVVIAINVDKLDTNINMSNVMGTTILTVEELRSQSNILMDSNKQRDLHLITNLASLSLESKGGVVGGLLDTKGLHVEVSQKRLQEREPHHNIKIGVGFFAFRLDYMGSSSLLANLTGLQVSEKDEWKCTMKGKERHLQSMYTNTAIYWDTMHLIICRSTTPDIFKSVNRLEEFVVQQLQSSKKMLSSWKPPGLETEGSQELPGGGHRRPPASSGKQTKNATEKVAMVTPGAKRKLKKQVSLKPEVIEAPPVLEESHWYTIFKWCRQVFGSQSSSLAQGLQLGGQVTLQGKKAVVTCFHGLNFRSSSWALFALREPHIQFETNAFEAPPEQGKSNTLVVQNLTFDLGHNQTQREDGWLAMIHRVYRNEKSHFPFNGTIAECFQYVSEIRCPEETEHYMRSQEFFPPSSSSSYKHKADPIFALPKLQMVMESKQHLMADGTLQDVEPVKVQVTFVTTFTDHLYVSMDVELLLFLHDLVIAYMEYKQKAMSLQLQSTSVASAAIKTADTGKVKGQTVKGEQDGKEKEEKKDEAPPSPSKDKREFNCSTWQLEPTVRIQTRTDHDPQMDPERVMDPSDIAVSFIVREMLKMMDEGSDDEKETKKTEVKRT
ncbi:hypothetical protein BSL78_03619 [Apostichopus japonicus]|uniref:Bridge-like lipid transfer protein family member 1 C-terminal domain-containing protein n=1 Tax=Stichopus japonicus TaxID=307972 RepID=A0A2G8LGV3_STIJA|nr:hypothetical protein BSL78_03619 [Apostichopus japonicus]